MCNQSPKCFEEQSQLNVERAASGTMKKQPRILPLPLRKLRVRMTIPSRAECIGSAAIFRVDPFDSFGGRVRVRSRAGA
jgi:hypothetical protein